MPQLLKKLAQAVISHSRDTNAKQTTIYNKFKYFDRSDWNNWKKTVSNFYQSNNKVSPLFVPQKLDNRPYISVRLFDQDITVLLDSGATSSVVGSSGLAILKHLGLKINNSIHKNICTADGGRKDVKGVVDLSVCVGSIGHVIKALVVPSLPQSFIFGVDFAKQFKIIVDFKEKSWDVQSGYSNSALPVYDHPTDIIPDILCSLDGLSPEERIKADKVIKSFERISNKDKLGLTDKVVMTINTGDAKPFKKRPHPLSPYMSEILNREVDDMLKLGVIEPSNSPWCSPVLLVKKPTGEFRFCFDGRGINEVTQHDSYPLPNINRILSNLRGAKYISSIDLRKAFWQIPLDPESRANTAFSII